MPRKQTSRPRLKAKVDQVLDEFNSRPGKFPGGKKQALAIAYSKSRRSTARKRG